MGISLTPSKTTNNRKTITSKYFGVTFDIEGCNISLKLNHNNVGMLYIKFLMATELVDTYVNLVNRTDIVQGYFDDRRLPKVRK